METFIEHQDTCNAVKLKRMEQSGGEWNLFVYQNDSPSHSGGTTQAMPFVTDASTKSMQVLSSVHDVDYTRRSTTAFNIEVAAWLRDRQINELELLQPPDAPSVRPHVSITSSTLSEDVNMPSLKLSIGPCEVETKPSSKETVTSAIYQRPSCSDVSRGTSARPQLGNDQRVGSGTKSLSEILLQAAKLSEVHQLKKLQTSSRCSKAVTYYNSHAAITHESDVSSYREDRAWKVHAIGTCMFLQLIAD